MESIVLERIRELLVFRRWYRQNRWATWTDIRKEHETELRALVRLARQARRLVAAAPDPVTQAKAQTDQRDFRDWADWQAHGPVTEDFDRESQPEFNGAFSRW